MKQKATRGLGGFGFLLADRFFLELFFREDFDLLCPPNP
jgi:hypothetical protein